MMVDMKNDARGFIRRETQIRADLKMRGSSGVLFLCVNLRNLRLNSF
jgi:hypothetical protein